LPRDGLVERSRGEGKGLLPICTHSKPKTGTTAKKKHVQIEEKGQRKDKMVRLHPVIAQKKKNKERRKMTTITHGDLSHI